MISEVEKKVDRTLERERRKKINNIGHNAFSDRIEKTGKINNCGGIAATDVCEMHILGYSQEIGAHADG